MKEPGIVRTIAFLDSIHVGSKYAVFPRNFKTESGEAKGLNSAQEKLIDYWEDFWREAKDVGVDTVVVLGEFIDGINKAENGDDLITTSIGEQKRACIKLFKPHLIGRKLFSISGSNYHVKADTLQLDKEITEELGGRHCGYILNCKFAPSEKIFNITHDSPDTMYKATALSREMTLIKEAEGIHSLPVPRVDVVVRGHIHKSLAIYEPHIQGFLVPGWKIYYVIKGRTRMYGRKIPVIGGVIVRITKDDRLRIWPEIYPTPHLEGHLVTS